MDLNECGLEPRVQCSARKAAASYIGLTLSAPIGLLTLYGAGVM